MHPRTTLLAALAVLTTTVAFTSTVSAASSTTANPPPVRRDSGKVTEVIDGDTVRIRIDGREKSVRILGIDTPELYGTTECGAKAATRSALRLLKVGARVRLSSDPSQSNKDQYGRLLRYVERDGHDFGRQQVLRGWAELFVWDDNPFARVASYRRAAAAAEDGNRGVWKQCDGNFHQPE